MPYTPPPAKTSISDTYPNPSNAVARIGFATLYDYLTNLLGTTGNPPEAQALLQVPGLTTSNTFAAKQTFNGAASAVAQRTTNIVEPITVLASPATGTLNFDFTTQSILYYTQNATANFTLNIRGSSMASTNTLLAIGDSICVSFLNTNGATAYYLSALQIDGNAVVPKWQGGTAPTTGNASSIDAYNFSIIKTAANAYTALASVSKFA